MKSWKLAARSAGLSCLFILCVALGLGGSAYALETKEDQKIAFQAAMAEMKTHYGMAKFKEENFGIKYSDLEAKYLRLIDTATTLEEDAGFRAKEQRTILPPEEFRQLMVGFAAEFKDGHTNIVRQSQKAWTVGIRTAAIGERLFVVGYNPQVVNPADVSPRFQVGDEIVEVDGRPVSDLARENALYMPMATQASKTMRALESILTVSNRYFRAKEKGAPVTVKFRRSEPGEAPQDFTGRFHWTATEDFMELGSVARYLMPERDPRELKARKLVERPYTYGESGTKRSYFREGLERVGLPRGAITDLGKLINAEILEARKKKAAGLPHDELLAFLEPVDRLAAYTVNYRGANLGVMRIPSYAPAEGYLAAVNELLWLSEVTARMEASTHAMILDQLSNGGGYVAQFTQLLRLFAKDGEIKTNQINIKLSETFFNSHDGVGDPGSDPELPLNGRYKNLARVLLEKDALKKLREKFDRGEKWSGYVSLFAGGGDYLPGESGRVLALEGRTYTKPMILLNDGRSASGGDFFPAAIQSAGRALIVGETSMGLGGPVYRAQESLPGSEMYMRCTMGHCIRGDGLTIENLGVLPDVPREISVMDVREGFGYYAYDVLEVAIKHLQAQDVAQIRTEMSAELTKRAVTRGGLVPSETFKAVQKVIAPVAKSYSSIKNAEQALPVYDAALKEIAKMKLEGLTHEEWAFIKLPLPRFLTDMDIFLASHTDRSSVVVRLGQMKRLPKFQSDPKVLELIEMLESGLSKWGPSAKFTGCRALLTSAHAVATQGPVVAQAPVAAPAPAAKP